MVKWKEESVDRWNVHSEQDTDGENPHQVCTRTQPYIFTDGQASGASWAATAVKTTGVSFRDSEGRVLPLCTARRKPTIEVPLSLC